METPPHRILKKGSGWVYRNFESLQNYLGLYHIVVYIVKRNISCCLSKVNVYPHEKADVAEKMPFTFWWVFDERSHASSSQIRGSWNPAPSPGGAF